MSNRVFCIGNGRSRRGFNLKSIKGRGVIIGCNNLYKDFAPDILVATNHPIMHEIYRSGYCYTANCYFRDWVTVPVQKFDSMIQGMFPEHRNIKTIRRDGLLIENQRQGSKELVIHGYTDKQTNQTEVSLSWCTEDKVKNLSDIYREHEQVEWGTGTTSGYVACKEISELKEVYLIGHDFFSIDKQFNNIYRGQKFYKSDTHISDYNINKWIYEWRRLFKWYNWIKFYKVNRENYLNLRLNAWDDCKNVEYISYERMETQTRSIP